MTNTTQKVDDIIKVISGWNNPSDVTNRISWNDYFMCMAYLAAARSPCHRLHVGCVLVKNKRVVSMGYNGFVTGEDHNSVVQVGCDGKPHEVGTMHAEQNAVCYGASNGVSVNDSIAFVTHYPCLNCAKVLETSGIKLVYYHEDYNNDPTVEKVCTNLKIMKI